MPLKGSRTVPSQLAARYTTVQQLRAGNVGHSDQEPLLSFHNS